MRGLVTCDLRNWYPITSYYHGGTHNEDPTTSRESRVTRLLSAFTISLLNRVCVGLVFHCQRWDYATVGSTHLPRKRKTPQYFFYVSWSSGIPVTRIFCFVSDILLFREYEVLRVAELIRLLNCKAKSIDDFGLWYEQVLTIPATSLTNSCNLKQSQTANSQKKHNLPSYDASILFTWPLYLSRDELINKQKEYSSVWPKLQHERWLWTLLSCLVISLYFLNFFAYRVTC